ncbi:MAG TPA: L,D-transpeptidase family protein [Longimicrobiales bacterium]
MKPELFIRSSAAWCTFVLLAGCSTTAPQNFNGYGTANVKARPVVASFVREQLRFSRVREARDSTETAIQEMFREHNISYPASEVYLRVFKQERSLELWVRSTNNSRFQLLRTYPICALAGVLGPNRTQGDGQVPEGFYSIDLFNPSSAYHLSMRINYPNQHDRAVSKQQHSLGGDIFIHGGCMSDGCVAITDQAIRELYWIAVSARGMGQQSIPVHIFPARMDNVKRMQRITSSHARDKSVLELWQTLRPGYDYFQKKQQLPEIGVDDRGQYRITG